MNNDVISRENLKKAMWDEAHSITTFNECGTEEAHIGLTITEIEHIIDNAPTVDTTFREVVAYECGQKSVERPQGEWIPVSERLPEDMQRVLVWFEYYRYGDYNCMYQTYGFGYVCDGKWSPFINGETGWQDARIIAWMPLPEPYKEASDE